MGIAITVYIAYLCFMTRGFYAIEIRDSNEARELAEMLKDEPVFCVSLERLITGKLDGYRRLLWDEDQWTLTNWVDNKTVINLEQVKQLILI